MKLTVEQIKAIRERYISAAQMGGTNALLDVLKGTLPSLLDHIAQIEAELDKAEKRVKLLEGAIERQNNTISYLSSTNGQGFNW